MHSATFAFIVAAGIAAILTPLVRTLAIRGGVVDDPTERHVHGTSTPRLGGVAVLVAFFVPLGLLFLLQTDVAEMFFDDPLLVVGLATGGCMVSGLGAVDDVRGVRAWHKLWVQVAAASVAFGCGFRIDAVTLPGLGTLSMGVFALPVTILWIVAIINALNLIDGLDGLAAGIAFFACVTNFIVAYIHGHALVMLLSATLGGSIVGFLFYNFNPASIFMGDSGSMFLGYVLATTSMLGNAVKSSTTVAILVPLAALGLPLMDTLFTMIRRFLERRPIFSPDRGHIHHRLLDIGLTHRRAVLTLYGLSILFASVAIAVALGRSWQVGGALLLLSVALVVIVRFAGYFEYLKLQRNQVMRSHTGMTEALRRAVPTTLHAIRDAGTAEELFEVLKELAAETGMRDVSLALGHNGGKRELRWQAPTPAPRSRRHRLGSSYPLAGTAGQYIAFTWLGEEPDVPPQADILLQLIVDACEAKMHPEHASHAPHSAGRRALRPATPFGG